MGKLLSTLLQHVPVIRQQGSADNITIEKITFDSRQAGPNVLFVAIEGTQTDGHQYIQQAIEAGAAAVVCQQWPETLPESSLSAIVQVADSAEALGLLAAAFYDFPSKELQVVGITGTNGKTTTATLLYKLFMAAGYQTGLLSTVVNMIGPNAVPATHTTPDAVSLQKMLRQMVAQGCTHVFMEVSSHALVQKRTAGLTFTGGVFTNITHDHLDYHKTFAEYIKAKKLLFDGLPKKAFALINTDDKRAKVMVQNTAADVHTFAIKNAAEFKGRLLESSMQGLLLEINDRQAWFNITGHFNAWNLTGVFSTAILLGEEEENILELLSGLQAVPGRFEQIHINNITGVVDYAHTPDALENVLESIKKLKETDGQTITVVGCGGNRDKEKRPVMAATAAKLSDRVILTSDNPRNEEPQQIIDDMAAGVLPHLKRKVLQIANRKEAIRTACQLASPGDVVLVAGKGHETYQEIKGVKHPFDDREILKQALIQL